MAMPFCRPENAAPAVYMSAALLLVLLARSTSVIVTMTKIAKIARFSQGLPGVSVASAARIFTSDSSLELVADPGRCWVQHLVGEAHIQRRDAERGHELKQPHDQAHG